MDLKTFSNDDLVALIGLLRLVMEADGTISPSEERTLESFANEAGRETWTAAIADAAVRTGTRAQAIALARAVTDQDKQDEILNRLCRMSGLDGAQTEELDVLDDLIGAWHRGG